MPNSIQLSPQQVVNVFAFDAAAALLTVLSNQLKMIGSEAESTTLAQYAVDIMKFRDKIIADQQPRIQIAAPNDVQKMADIVNFPKNDKS